MKTIALALIAAVTFTSCQTYRKAVEVVSQNPELVQPIVALVTSTVFSKVVDPAELKSTAQKVDKIADKVLNTKFETKPTQLEVEALIADALPDTTWGPVLASTVALQYTKFTKKIDASDVEKSVAVLKSIAGALKVSAAKYL